MNEKALRASARVAMAAVFAAASGIACAAAQETAADAKQPSAAQRMSEPGPQLRGLEPRVGVWDVTATLWPAPGAKPIVTAGLIAERTLIGPFLQEIMRPVRAASAAEDFRRIDYLTYDRVEGRWKYVSMDTRFPVSIMPAWSFGDAEKGALRLLFEPLAFVGYGNEVQGRLMRSDMVITERDGDHELKQQHFITSDGSGAQWLAVQYEYSRHK
jgi:hypothetical protein